jgi:hypothetical protein
VSSAGRPASATEAAIGADTPAARADPDRVKSRPAAKAPAKVASFTVVFLPIDLQEA